MIAIILRTSILTAIQLGALMIALVIVPLVLESKKESSETYR